MHNRTNQEARENIATFISGSCVLVILVVLFAVVLSGCSTTKLVETYDGNGGLATRRFVMHQGGTTRQATFKTNQEDGIYNWESGETVDVSSNAVQMVAIPINAAAAAGGLAILGATRPNGTLAPVSLDSFNPQGGFGASPITAEQQSVLNEREVTRRTIEELRTSVERLRLELEAERAEAEAEAAAREAESQEEGSDEDAPAEQAEEIAQ